MKAVVLRRTGGPEQLELEDVPDPQPQPGQVRVTVRAAAVNFADVLVRRGDYPQPPELPAVLGNEIAGEADGRRVIALTGGGGGYAGLACVDERWVVPLPEAASFEEGAAFLLAFLTAYLPLTRQARVGGGSAVLVHAGSGGVGSAAIQLAKHLGARVIATSSAEKRDFALELGADEVYDYDTFAGSVRADVVVDPVGGPVFARSLGALEPLGVLIAIGYAAGSWEQIDPALLVGRNVGVQGFYLGRLMRHRPELVRRAAGELLDLWQEGAVRPVVGARFALGDAAEAHRLIEERRHRGKVLLAT